MTDNNQQEIEELNSAIKSIERLQKDEETRGGESGSEWYEQAIQELKRRLSKAQKTGL